MYSNQSSLSRGSGLVLQNNVPDYLVGRLLTIVEALGLRDSQEKSTKDLIRQEVYNTLGVDNYFSVTGINSNLNDELHRVINEMKEEARASGSSFDARFVPFNDDYQFKVTWCKNPNAQTAEGSRKS